ncbi:TPA: XRE family transcriptional regulator [Streptococcus suis]
MKYYVDTELIDKILDKKTQSEIAEGAGVPQSVISELKRNRKKYERMALSTAHKLTQYAYKLEGAGYNETSGKY